MRVMKFLRVIKFSCQMQVHVNRCNDEFHLALSLMLLQKETEHRHFLRDCLMGSFQGSCIPPGFLHT